MIVTPSRLSDAVTRPMPLPQVRHVGATGYDLDEVDTRPRPALIDATD
jgi:hypothetical protein